MKHLFKKISFGFTRLHLSFIPKMAETKYCVLSAMLLSILLLSPGCKKNNVEQKPEKLIVLDAIYADGKLETQFHYGPNKKISKKEYFVNGWAAQAYEMHKFEYDAKNALKQVDHFYEGINKYRTIYSSSQADHLESSISIYVQDGGKIYSIDSYKYDNSGRLISIGTENPEDFSKGGTMLFTYYDANKLASLTQTAKNGHVQTKLNFKNGLQLSPSVVATFGLNSLPDFLIDLNKFSTTEMILTFYKPESIMIESQYRYEYLQRTFNEQGNMISQVEKIKKLKPFVGAGPAEESKLTYTYKEL